MKKISFVKSSDGVFHIHAEGKNYSISKEHPNYLKIKDAVINDDVSDLDHLCDIPKQIQVFSNQLVEVRDGIVYYKGEALQNNKIANRILDLMKDGFPFDHMLKFLTNLMENPSRRAVYELLEFLENRALPITDDGCFYAYKRVKSNWCDFQTGNFDNSIGKTLTMPRNEVDDDHRHDCSFGFHVGSIEYVKGFNSGGHVLIVKVNPKDVVSVPSDGQSQKCRVCSYTVIQEYTEDLQQSPIYDQQVNPVVPSDKYDYLKEGLHNSLDFEDDDDLDEDFEDDEDDEDDDDDDWL